MRRPHDPVVDAFVMGTDIGEVPLTDESMLKKPTAVRFSIGAPEMII
jgi:hypothetical protein